MSEIFGMVGQGNIADVASSLSAQGVNTEMSIPIYEVFYLKLLPGTKAGFICDSIAELSAIRELGIKCGSVCCTVNLLDMDMLTLVAMLAVCTPQTGYSVFYKSNVESALQGLETAGEAIASSLVSLAGLDIDVDFDMGTVSLDMAAKAIDMLANRLFGTLEDEFSHFGIAMRPWEQLPEFIHTVKQSGDMNQMFNFRKQMGASIL